MNIEILNIQISFSWPYSCGAACSGQEGDRLGDGGSQYADKLLTFTLVDGWHGPEIIPDNGYRSPKIDLR